MILLEPQKWPRPELASVQMKRFLPYCTVAPQVIKRVHTVTESEGP